MNHRRDALLNRSRPAFLSVRTCPAITLITFAASTVPCVLSPTRSTRLFQTNGALCFSLRMSKMRGFSRSRLRCPQGNILEALFVP